MGILQVIKGKYEGCEGDKLSQEECSLRDDIPGESIEEMVLKVMAGGQLAEERRRRAFYDVDDVDASPDDVDEIECEGDGIDYITAFNELKLRRINEWRERHNFSLIRQKSSSVSSERSEDNEMTQETNKGHSQKDSGSSAPSATADK